MTISLQHVSILTPDIGSTISFYSEMLGMHLIDQFVQEQGSTVASLCDGHRSSPFSIILISPPYTGWMKETYEERGPSISHLSFLVDDVDAWYKDLDGNGANLIHKPHRFPNGRHMYLQDPDGVVVEIMSLIDTVSSEKQPRLATGEGFSHTLHHTSITCNNLDSLEGFYRHHLRMETFYERREHDIIFLADPALIKDKSRSCPALELIGPKCHNDRNSPFLRRFGPYLDHISFLVDDVDAAHAELLSKGVKFDIEPMDFPPNRIAFFRDPNGISIELELGLWDERIEAWRKRRFHS